MVLDCMLFFCLACVSTSASTCHTKKQFVSGVPNKCVSSICDHRVELRLRESTIKQLASNFYPWCELAARQLNKRHFFALGRLCLMGSTVSETAAANKFFGAIDKASPIERRTETAE